MHTGDLHSDIEYDRPYGKIPEMVKKFLPFFKDVINDGNIFEIQNIYENTFPKLSLQYFETRPWPDEHEVAPLVDNDSVSIFFFVLKNLL